MNKDRKSLCIGFGGGILGNALIFAIFSLITPKYGTLAEWISSIGTISSLIFVYWQIDEQRIEFQKSRSRDFQIAFSLQPQVSKTKNGGIMLGKRDYYIWGVNAGMVPVSFKFIGFCKKKDFKHIKDQNVVYNPYITGFEKLLPHPTNDFENLKPGQISKEHKFSEDEVLKNLDKCSKFFVLYMDALGKIYKREINVTYNHEGY